MKARYPLPRLFAINPFVLPVVVMGLASAGVFSLGEDPASSEIQQLSVVLAELPDSLHKTAKTDDTNVPDIIASMQDSLDESDGDNLADPGESIVYTVTLFNNGGDTAKGVVFDMSTVDPLLTYNNDLSSSVVAVGDSFGTSSSAALAVPSGTGLLANDIDLDGDITTVTAPATSTKGASVAVSNDGSFLYTPAVGSSGLDTFQYVIMDDDGNKDSAIVKISLTSSIFFVDDDASPSGDGSLATPFKTIAELNASSEPAAGDTIYFYSGSYSGNITLLANQKLLGQGSALSTGSISIAAGADPVITATSQAVTLASNNTVRGLTLNTGATGTGISGTGALGTVSIENVLIQLDGTGTGVSLSPTSGTVAFDGSSPTIADPSPTGGAKAVSITSNSGIISFAGSVGSNGTGVSIVNNGGTVSFTGGLSLFTGASTAFSVSGGTIQVSGNNVATTTSATAVNLSNTNLGTGVTFQSISTNAASSGIVLSNTSGGAFTVTGISSTDGTGGTIQNNTQFGLTATTTSNAISLSNMSFTNNGGTHPGTCTPADASGCSAHLKFGAATGAVTLTNVDVSTGGGQGVLGLTVSGGFTYTNGTVTNVGNNTDYKDGINLYGVSGNVTISNSTISGSAQDNVFISTAAGSTTLAITDNTISNSSGPFRDDGIQIECATGTLNADITSNTIGSFNGWGLEIASSSTGTIASMDVTGNTLTNGARFSAANTASTTFNLNNNPTIGSPAGNAAVSVRGSGDGAVNGRINSNTSIAPSSGFSPIDVLMEDDATGVLEINSNGVTISATGAYGVELVSDPAIGGVAPELDVSMDNNTIGVAGGGFPVAGILAEVASTGTVCVNIDNTGIFGFSTGFRGRPVDSGSTLEMEGFTTTVDAWWTAGGNAQSTSSSGSGTFQNGTCTTVSHPGPSAHPIVIEDLTPAIEDPFVGAVEPDQTDAIEQNLETFFDESTTDRGLLGSDRMSKSSALPFGANVGSLPPGKTIVLVASYTVQPYGSGVTSIISQGQVTGSNFAAVPTDDPDTGTAGDATSTVVDPGAALPVELVSFTAIVDQTDVVLQWQTASETNNAGFEVEQLSTSSSAGLGEDSSDDTSWERLAFVEGHGTTDSPQSYAYRIDDLRPGQHRFRLKQIDFDGAFEYSPIVEAVIEVPSELSLRQNYPNPFNPQTNIDFTVPASGQTSLKVFSMLGRQVATLFDGQAESGRLYSTSLDARGLATGQYVYVLDFQGVKISKTMLVIR